MSVEQDKLSNFERWGSFLASVSLSFDMLASVLKVLLSLLVDSGYLVVVKTVSRMSQCLVYKIVSY